MMSTDSPQLESEQPPSRRLTFRRALLALTVAALGYWLFDWFLLPWLRGERTLRGHTASAHCLAFAPDGSRLYSGGDDGKVLAWDMESFESEVVLDFAPHPVEALAVSPDGTLLAVAVNF